MSKQTVGYYKHFLVQPPTPAVEKINEFTFTNFAKSWAHMGFVPVLREIGERTYHVKLYLNALKIKDREELCMFTATYFREMVRELSSHAKCTQILVYARTWLTPEDISSADSLNDLEQSLLTLLPDETPFKCNDNGEGITHALSNIPEVFNHWNALILDGYFEPEYEEKCRLEDEKKKQEELSRKTVSLTFFMKKKGPDSVSNYPPSLQHGFPENKPVGEILKEYCKIDLKNHNLTTLFDELEKRYLTTRNQLQPTYAQYSSIKLLNKYNYIKNQILSLDCWSEDELLQNKDRQIFRKK